MKEWIRTSYNTWTLFIAGEEISQIDIFPNTNDGELVYAKDLGGYEEFDNEFDAMYAVEANV